MSRAAYEDWRLNRKAQVLAPDVLGQCRAHPLLADLYVHSTGEIRRGLGHHFERETIGETIILYCVEGQGWLHIDSTTHRVQAQDVVFVLRDQAHGYGADDQDPWSIHWAHFNGAHVTNFLDLMGVSPQHPILTLRAQSRTDLAQLFNGMFALLDMDHSLPCILKAAAYLRQILSTLVLVKASLPDPPAQASAVDCAIQVMHEKITDTLRLADLAQQVNLSSSHLHRLFREETGTTPINYFINLKIQHACELLDTTEMKVNEISRFLGYSDPHYFSRVFKQVTGHAPRRFRALRRAGSQSV